MALTSAEIAYLRRETIALGVRVSADAEKVRDDDGRPVRCLLGLGSVRRSCADGSCGAGFCRPGVASPESGSVDAGPDAGTCRHCGPECEYVGLRGQD